MLQGQFARLVHTGEHKVRVCPIYYGTLEKAFLSLFNLPRDLAPKYLTGLMFRSILQGGNSAPKSELRPRNRWYTRRSFAPKAGPWTKTQEQNPSCVSALSLVALKSREDVLYFALVEFQPSLGRLIMLFT